MNIADICTTIEPEILGKATPEQLEEFASLYEGQADCLETIANLFRSQHAMLVLLASNRRLAVAVKGFTDTVAQTLTPAGA